MNDDIFFYLKLTFFLILLEKRKMNKKHDGEQAIVTQYEKQNTTNERIGQRKKRKASTQLHQFIATMYGTHNSERLLSGITAVPSCEIVQSNARVG